MRTLEWHGCYEGSWNGLIVPGAFAHPAKFAHGLIRHIIEHGFVRGYWREGETIGDPFGGVALGGIIAGYYGLNWIGVELECKANGGSPFVELGNQNLDLHRPKWSALGYDVSVRLVQGDSREFAAIVGQLAGAVTSPPFVDCFPESGDPKYAHKFHGNQAEYGTTPGQIGRLKAGSLDAAISSPPYAEGMGHGDNGKGSHDPDKERQRVIRAGGDPGKVGRNSAVGANDYGHTPGNIGNLKQGRVEACVTSPPWGKQNERLDGDPDGNVYRKWCEQNGRDPKSNAARQLHDRYGQSDGQIGNESGQTYWEAMRQVYAQMHAALKPGGIAAIVLKDYVSKGQRVPLCDDSLKLLVSLGFEPVERVHAMLVKETVENTLFAGPVTKTKERKSFFRRLAEKKGSPRIDWEEVLFVRRKP